MAFPPPVVPFAPEVITHITAGSIAILTGYAAVLVRKGERPHRILGTIFTAAMLIMAGIATYLAIGLQGQLPGQTVNIAAGLLTLYLVSTAWMTVRRTEGRIGVFEKLAPVGAVGLGVVFLMWGLKAAASPSGSFDGYPAGFYFVPAGIAAFMAALDAKVIWQGGLSGRARIARHLWRMCFALFVAAGSFFIGQQKIMPASVLEWRPVLFALGLAPLVFLIFWLIRVRLTKWYERGAAGAAQERLLPRLR